MGGTRQVVSPLSGLGLRTISKPGLISPGIGCADPSGLDRARIFDVEPIYGHGSRPGKVQLIARGSHEMHDVIG